jgi:ATP-dependent DNA ligase
MAPQIGFQHSKVPGVFEKTIFSARSRPLLKSIFIHAMHPKTEIKAQAATIQKILDAGWVGQLKIHGHRAQIHVPADPTLEPYAYNRQGRIHKKLLPEAVILELRRLFTPERQWNVIDAEWLKETDKLFVFDLLKQNGETLVRLNYSERWRLLPRLFISPSISVLPVFTDLKQCLEALETSDPTIEGLVFKSQTSPGFEDTSIVRCRKSSSRY